jgi:hypothetical protein
MKVNTFTEIAEPALADFVPLNNERRVSRKNLDRIRLARYSDLTIGTDTTERSWFTYNPPTFPYVGDLNLPANFFVLDRVLDISAHGFVETAASGTNTTIKLKLDGTAQINQLITWPINLANGAWELRATIGMKHGASTNMYAIATLWLTPTLATFAAPSAVFIGYTAFNFAITAATTFDLTSTHGTTNGVILDIRKTLVVTQGA